MSSKNLPPEVDREIAALKGRLTRIEKRLAKRIPEIPGETLPFSLAGPVYETSSGAYVHPTGANLVLLIATLVVPGITATEIRAKRNGDAIGDLLTIDADANFARTKVPTVPFAALFDRLELELVTPGDGAADLVVLAVFDA